MRSFHKPAGLWRRSLFVSGLAPDVRYNLTQEVWGSVAFGLFWGAALQFIPVVLRRLGATPELLALYTAQTYLGSILTSFSIVLMRRRRSKSFAVACWTAGRTLFLLFAVITRVPWMLLLTGVFWLAETFPSPAYTRIMQAVYPEKVRGRAMSYARVGMVAAILVVTPLAGWALDQVGYQVLFPLAGLMGLLAVWFFNRMEVNEGTLPPRQTRTFTQLWGIVRRNHPFALHLLAFTVYGVGVLLGFAYYPIVQVDRLHLSYFQIGLLGFAQSLAWLLGFLFWGRTIDRIGAFAVLRTNMAIGFMVPFPYIFATEGWMLLPSFIAQGIVAAGIDLGVINTAIQLAEPESVTEYAAIQATVIGVRGMISPFIGVALVALGVPETAVFAAGSLAVLLSVLVAWQVKAPPVNAETAREQRSLRTRWPLRPRNPRL